MAQSLRGKFKDLYISRFKYYYISLIKPSFDFATQFLTISLSSDLFILIVLIVG